MNGNIINQDRVSWITIVVKITGNIEAIKIIIH
jgi:phosphopantothenoylcysteine synthetase/decarboxylase